MNGYTEGRVRQNTISPSTQRIDYDLGTVKIDDNTEVVLGVKKILGMQRMATLKVVTKRVPQHIADRLRFEGC